MKKILLAGLAILSVSGCAVEPLTLQNEVTYIAEWIGDEPVVGRNPVSLTFSEDRAYGNAGCNHWFASYQLDGQKLRFSEIGSTRKMCAEHIMKQEQHFLELLSQIERWDVSKIDQLRFWPTEGAPLRVWPEQN
ncbi:MULTISPECIES: META domain-containing protein [Pseudomonadaceae]|jgi:heat shock protein HslJ|uniref:META domain-containing protein n=1 Tax=Stutzerimonas zhaodongensis TaxID=1176257 RepID=A0ABX8ITU5_9GAMM|nr:MULTISPECIES: META domain-containing protein [Pseudomonadaceae]MAL38210.1 META domain-containing protein [Pseudomonas sp.]MBU0948726.1 META domain-containing protein [Gammaproteobacteria bacterium]KJJ64049.1 lipoprotein [Pseudomonas sp. 10B238]MBK3796856.1 META domain-containing protein [Stutzerimonas stutzeri]MBK3877359.1 META domain-containing protein [Stutzerimonas stutzeri]|tara:strand:- start:340 stop:741 length:402 start_codon:yes stop_codon:yes gene_type:complete